MVKKRLLKRNSFFFSQPWTLPCVPNTHVQEEVLILSQTQQKSKVPSGRGFGFSSPPSCMSSKAKETFKTWKEKCSVYAIAHSFLGPCGSWDLPLGSDGARETEAELKFPNLKEKWGYQNGQATWSEHCWKSSKSFFLFYCVKLPGFQLSHISALSWKNQRARHVHKKQRRVSTLDQMPLIWHAGCGSL